MPTTRVLVPIDSAQLAAWQTAIAAADAICAQAGPPLPEVILLTHTKQQLKGTTLAGHLGTMAKSLAAGQSATLPCGAVLRAETLQTIGLMSRPSVVIAAYADEKMLTTLDGFRQAAGIVALPEFVGGVANWEALWNPFVPGQASKAASVLISDTRVEKALQFLTGYINLSHAMLNPRDKSHADETLRILAAKGHALDPANIKGWAMRNGWHPTAAGELGALATKIKGLSAKPSLAKISSAQSRYDAWV
jgi:hypothetical protein